MAITQIRRTTKSCRNHKIKKKSSAKEIDSASNLFTMTENETIPTNGSSSAPPSRGFGYVRRGSVFLSNAELAFDHMKFVAGSGKKEKVILDNVGARVTNGRK